MAGTGHEKKNAEPGARAIFSHPIACRRIAFSRMVGIICLTQVDHSFEFCFFRYRYEHDATTEHGYEHGYATRWG